MADKVGFGIVGCGVIAPWHAKSIKACEKAKLVAVCDVVEEKAKKIAGEMGCDHYTDYEKMLERDDLKVISICTPSSLHPAQAVAAAKAGKHSITEKPMAVTLKEADEMIAECKKAKVKLGVIFQRRVKDEFIDIKKAVDSGQLGRIVLADVYMKYYRSQEYYDSGDWRGTWEFDGGGALMNQGIHCIDLVQWIMGGVDSVFGYAETLARKIEVEDTSVAVLKFKNGAIGVIEGTTSVYPSDIPHRIEIHGEKGSILIEGEGVKRWVVEGEDGKPVEKTAGAGGVGKAITSPTDIGFEGHKKLIAGMVDAIEKDRDPLITGEEGKKALEVILAIYAASHSGKLVKLPLLSDPVTH